MTHSRSHGVFTKTVHQKTDEPEFNVPIRQRIAFRCGKLIDFECHGVLAASQWPDMKAWHKLSRNSLWKPVLPAFWLHHYNGVCQGWFAGPWDTPRCHFTLDKHIRFRLHRPPELTCELDNGSSTGDDDDIHEFPDIAWNSNSFHSDRIEKKDAKAMADYMRPIPPEVLAAISKFPESHWTLLNLASLSGHTLDLIDCTPGLVAALSAVRKFRTIPTAKAVNAAAAQLKNRQIDIASWLGFPGNDTSRV